VAATLAWISVSAFSPPFLNCALSADARPSAIATQDPATIPPYHGRERGRASRRSTADPYRTR